MGERVLVADGDLASVRILSRFLTELGAETVSCASGADCLAEIEQDDFSMLFIEVVLPEISGLDVLTTLRNRYDPIELPVVIVTTNKNKELGARAIDQGANDLIFKPLKSPAAIATIYRRISAQQQHRQRLQKARSEIIKSTISTYNYEIKNTLSAAFAELQIARLSNDSITLSRVSKALNQISGVVRKIEELGPGDVEETGYLLGEKLLRLRKDLEI